MAHQIKVIQCPKCGSTDKTEIKPDYFVCKNCNTEYYLDNDDITINHNVNYSSSQPLPTQPLDKKRLGLILIPLVIIFVFVTVIPRLFTSNSHSSSQGIVLTKTSWLSAAKSFFINDKGEPILVIAGKRNDDDNASVSFVNMETGKEVKLQKLTTTDDKTSDFVMQHFTNGDVFVIGNKMKIYKVDETAYALTNVSVTMLAQHPEMSSGIANAEFIFRPDGEGFKFINNEGKNYFYFPLNDKIYTAKEKLAASDHLKVKDPGEKLVMADQFTQKSFEFPEEPLQLIQYTKKDNNGGPDYNPWLEWGKDYSNGVAVKTIFKFGKEYVRSWKDLTPGHNYFNPSLLYFDKDFVLYSAASTPAQNAPKILQCVDASTGAIKWTMPLDDEAMESAVKCKDGFLINKTSSANYISNEGKLIRKYSII